MNYNATNEQGEFFPIPPNSPRQEKESGDETSHKGPGGWFDPSWREIILYGIISWGLVTDLETTMIVVLILVAMKLIWRWLW